MILISNACPLAKIKDLNALLSLALGNTLTNKQHQFARLVDKLNLVSPLNTLSRGYAIARKDEQVIRSIKEVNKGDALNIRVQDEEVNCIVDTTKATTS